MRTTKHYLRFSCIHQPVKWPCVIRGIIHGHLPVIGQQKLRILPKYERIWNETLWNKVKTQHTQFSAAVKLMESIIKLKFLWYVPSKNIPTWHWMILKWGIPYMHSMKFNQLKVWIKKRIFFCYLDKSHQRRPHMSKSVGKDTGRVFFQLMRRK